MTEERIGDENLQENSTDNPIGNSTLENNAVRKKAKLTFLAIIGISVLPIAAAYFMFFTGIGVPSTTVNSGLLLNSALATQDILDENSWKAINEDKKWRLLLPLTADCKQLCQDKFYTTRQVHIRLGEKATRVERYALNIEGDAGLSRYENMQEDHPLLKIANVDNTIWREWIANTNEISQLSAEEYYFLVDQEGYAMMVYTTQHGNDLLKDIKRALKYSIDYQ